MNKSPDLFRYYCGNKYVNQINWGASLYVAVKFNFHSVADKQTFDEAASASYGNIGSLSESLSKVIDKIDKNGSISVVAYQMGGDPTKLGKILGGKGDDAPIVACSFDHLDSCDQLLNNVITYAISDTGDNFPTQVTVGSPDIPVSAAPTGKVTDDYAGLAIFNGAASQLSPDIIAARKRLAGQLTQTNKNINRANYLINFSDYLPYKEKVQNELAKLIQNKPVLEQAGYICFDQLDNCLQAEKDANNQLQPIDQDILNGPTQKIYLNQTFAINGHTSASTIFALPINDLDSDVKSAKIVKLNNLQYIGGQYAAGPDSPPTGLNIFYTPSLDITGNLVPIFNGSGSLTFQLPSTIQTEQYACVGRSCVMNNEDTHFTADVEVDLYK